MRIIQTADLTPESIARMGETDKLHVYNGLDCAVTLEILHNIQPQLSNLTTATYEFEKSLQGPVLEMNMRGTLIDQARRREVIDAYEKDIATIQASLEEILWEGLEIKLNHRSPDQLKNLFYEILQVPAVKKRNTKGAFTPTVNREALEKISDHFHARPLAKHILALRDLEKKVSTLKTEIDRDGRWRTSYNIAGTTTGRLASSFNVMGTGANAQNIEERLRQIFIADPEMKMAYIDLEQAESRAVGAICYNAFGLSNYLDACESGDLHTSVVKMCWADMPWTGELKHDKELAESPFYRQHSYRHMCKVLGHGSNYRGRPFTMSQHTKIDKSIITNFQTLYFSAFPEIPMWHELVADTIKREGKLVSLMGRERHFFGRRDDDSTIREAVAFDPQSSVADILNSGMLRVWRSRVCQLLMQIHDAILIQYPEQDEDIVIPQVTKLLLTPVELRNNRTLLIPCDVMTGWNWRKASEDNPDGLRKYRGHDERVRTRHPPIIQLD